MHKNIFSALSSVPNFKGKLFLLEKYYQAFLKKSGNYSSRTWTGVNMSLAMEDRIQRRIFIKKCHEPETEKHLLQFAEKAKCFLDIGANIGYFSLMLARKNPGLTVFAFEPNPSNLKKIEENVRLNGLNNVMIQNCCLSDSEGEVPFFVPPENESGWGHIGKEGEQPGSFRRTMVQAHTLDQLFEKGVLSGFRPDLIKIDVEGFESPVLAGGKRMIQECRPVICMELNESCLEENHSSADALMNQLLSYGYKAYYITTGGELAETTRPLKPYPYLNYFFIPVS